MSQAPAYQSPLNAPESRFAMFHVERTNAPKREGRTLRRERAKNGSGYAIYAQPSILNQFLSLSSYFPAVHPGGPVPDASQDLDDTVRHRFAQFEMLRRLEMNAVDRT